MKGRKQWKIAVILLFVVVCGAFYLRIQDSGRTVEMLPEHPYASEEEKETENKITADDREETPDLLEAVEQKEEQETEEKEEKNGKEEEEEEEEERDNPVKIKVVVHVCGAVVKEGVYDLPEGARVIDAIEAAGGFTEAAARSYWNQADYLEDGEQIYVPSKEEAAEWEAAGTKPLVEHGGKKTTDSVTEAAEDGKVNLNEAGREELMSLPGIGESKAEAILSYREAKGGFQKIEELMEIPGIKEGIFRKLEERITIESR